MGRDITVRGTWRKLEELGYAATSATNPSRIDTSSYLPRKVGFGGLLSTHPAAVFTYPTPYHAPEFTEESRPGMRRGIVVLALTAYLLSDARQAKAVLAALERHKLVGGPYRVDEFGNREYPLRWDDHEPLWNEHKVRETHPDDDATVIIRRQAAEPNYRHDLTDQFGRAAQVPITEAGTFILELEGQWHQGHILDTPHKDLPELLREEVREIIGDCERARWGARPATNSKEAA